MAEGRPNIIVGLGNPGRDYAGHRHNVGYRVVEALAAARRLAWSETDGHCRVARDADLILVQPLRYMNRSGEALAAWARAAGVEVTTAPEPEPETDGAAPGAGGPAGIRPLVVCDDLALPLGAVRLRARGSSGGQNGLLSLIENLGGEEFPRLRLGIAPEDGVDPADWADYVLEDFAAGEAEAVDEMIAHAAAAAECWRSDGLEAAVSRFNRRRGPEDA